MASPEEVIVGAELHEWFGDDVTLDGCEKIAVDLLGALKAAGYAVVELPKPLPGRVEGEFPRWESAGDWIVIADSLFHEVLFTGHTLDSSGARELATRLLAAADAAEATQ